MEHPSPDGVLGKKTKEFIALALGVAAHCDACIGFHVQALVKLGATMAELEEALAMGPASQHLSMVSSVINYERLLG